MKQEENIILARVAEKAGRFDDMVEYLKLVVDSKKEDFNIEQITLLSDGFKKQIKGKRIAIQIMSTIRRNAKY